MIEWIILGLVVAVVVVAIALRPRGDDRTLPKEYCDVECKDCEGCR